MSEPERQQQQVQQLLQQLHLLQLQQQQQLVPTGQPLSSPAAGGAVAAPTSFDVVLASARSSGLFVRAGLEGDSFSEHLAAFRTTPVFGEFSPTHPDEDVALFVLSLAGTPPSSKLETQLKSVVAIPALVDFKVYMVAKLVLWAACSNDLDVAKAALEQLADSKRCQAFMAAVDALEYLPENRKKDSAIGILAEILREGGEALGRARENVAVLAALRPRAQQQDVQVDAPADVAAFPPGSAAAAAAAAAGAVAPAHAADVAALVSAARPAAPWTNATC